MRKFALWVVYTLFVMYVTISIGKPRYSDEVQNGRVISDKIINQYKKKGNNIDLMWNFADKYTLCFISTPVYARGSAMRLFPEANIKYIEAEDSNFSYLAKYNSDNKNMYVYMLEKLIWNMEFHDNPPNSINYDTTCTKKLKIIEYHNRYYISPIKE